MRVPPSTKYRPLFVRDASIRDTNYTVRDSSYLRPEGIPPLVFDPKLKQTLARLGRPKGGRTDEAPVTNRERTSLKVNQKAILSVEDDLFHFHSGKLCEKQD